MYVFYEVPATRKPTIQSRIGKPRLDKVGIEAIDQYRCLDCDIVEYTAYEAACELDLR